jgi:Fic family protein
MKAEDFSQDMPGQLVPTERRDGLAFVPEPLPPRDFPLDFELTNQLSEADVALATLEGLARTLRDPRILLRPFLLKEAVDSSRIEGTQTTYSDLLLFEAASASAQRAADPDTRVTANYIAALDYGIERTKELPFSRRLMCEVHGHLMRGYNEHKSRPGQIRTGQVVIGAPNATPDTARFVPPPGSYLDQLITDFEKFCNDYKGMPVLLRIALAHYQFETIHPFWDGNGRVGRLLISLLMTAEGRLSHPMLYLSGYFEKNRTEYYDRLLKVSERAAWREWVAFFLEGVRTQAVDACERIKAFQALRARLDARVTTRKRGAASDSRFLDRIFELQITSVPLARKWLGLSAPSAKDAIDRFVEHGILRRIEGFPGKTHYWFAPEIISVIQGVELDFPTNESPEATTTAV